MRSAAVVKLEDPKLLARIARKEYYPVRCAALRNRHLTDQSLLRAFASAEPQSFYDERNYLRLAAATNPNLTEQALLARIVTRGMTMDSGPGVIEKLTVPAVLEQIALGNAEPRNRRAAVANPLLTDVGTLASVAITDKDWEVRLSAVSKVTDDAVLGRVARTGEVKWLRRAAVERLADRAVLADVARNDQDSDVRAAAVIRLEDADVLVAIARVDTSWQVREAAGWRLKCHELRTELTEVATAATACDAGDHDACRALADVARAGKDGILRKAAAEKLTDQLLLAEVARHAQDWPPREAAVARLTDQALLAAVARDAPHCTVREVAAKRLTDRAVLGSIARSVLRASRRVPGGADRLGRPRGGEEGRRWRVVLPIRHGIGLARRGRGLHPVRQAEPGARQGGLAERGPGLGGRRLGRQDQPAPRVGGWRSPPQRRELRRVAAPRSSTSASGSITATAGGLSHGRSASVCDRLVSGLVDRERVEPVPRHAARGDVACLGSVARDPEGVQAGVLLGHACQPRGPDRWSQTHHAAGKAPVPSRSSRPSPP